jgi:predicted transcriptional regulator
VNVVASYLRRNSVGVDQIGAVVTNVTQALGDADRHLAGGASEVRSVSTAPAERPEPATSVRSSVKPEYIVCLECGAKLKTLKRHLQSTHGLNPKQYRDRWELKPEYPMTAPLYSERRRLCELSKIRPLSNRPFLLGGGWR